MPSSGVQTCALDRKSTRLNSSHTLISYAVFCLKKTILVVLLDAPVRPRSSVPALVSPSAPRSAEARARRLRPLPDQGAVQQRGTEFFFKNGAAPDISPLPLPDALPI